MADNTTLNTMTGGDVIATDEIAGVKHQRVKIEYGIDGAATDVSSTNPLPIGLTQTITLSDSSTTPLAASATWTSTAMDSALYGNFFTSFTLADVPGTHYVDESLDGSAWSAIHTTTVAASDVHLDQFSVHARYVRSRYTNGASPQASFQTMCFLRPFGAVDTVSLSEAGNIVKGDKENNTGTPSVEAFEVLAAVANASAPSRSEGNVVALRTNLAGDLAVTLDTESVTVSATDLDIRDLAYASDSVTAELPVDQVATDTITALNDSVSFTVSAGRTTGAFQVTGTWTGTLSFQRNLDSTNWEPLPVSTGSDVVTSTTINGIFVFPISAAAQIRVTATLWSTGTATVTAVRSVGSQTVRLASALPSGTNSIGTVTAANTAGDVAHDTGDGGNPVKIGGVARTTNPTAVTAGDRVNASFTDTGEALVVLGKPRDLVIQNTITLSTTGETTLLAQAASTFHDLTCLMCTNTSATATRVDFRDATTGTVRFSLAIAANGGAVINFPVPIAQTAVNTNWTAQLSGAVTDIRIFAQAIKNV